MIPLYLDGDFQEPPYETGERYYTVTPIPFSGRHDGEILATVDPPIVCADGSFSTVRLQARELRIREEIGKLICGEQDVVTVFVSSADEIGDGFAIRVSSLATHVPEVWARGGYWQWFVDAINAFVERHGHADVPEDHVEDSFDLGVYVAGLRERHQYGTLMEEEENLLNALPGWRW